MIIYTPCSPDSELCFVTNEEDAYFEFQTKPYKKIEILDKFAPICLEEHTCENFTCHNIESCIETHCSDDTLEDGESCLGSERSDIDETLIETVSTESLSRNTI